MADEKKIVFHFAGYRGLFNPRIPQCEDFYAPPYFNSSQYVCVQRVFDEVPSLLMMEMCNALEIHDWVLVRAVRHFQKYGDGCPTWHTYFTFARAGTQPVHPTIRDDYWIINQDFRRLMGLLWRAYAEQEIWVAGLHSQCDLVFRLIEPRELRRVPRWQQQLLSVDDGVVTLRGDLSAEGDFSEALVA